MVKLEDYSSHIENQWCPGCSNFGILTAMKHALLALDKNPEEICLVSGIGQAAKLPHYLKCNFFNGLHGRALPIAVSINIVNPELTTIVVTGDGDCYGEGGNHFLHTIRRNPEIWYSSGSMISCLNSSNFLSLFSTILFLSSRSSVI